MQSATQLKTQKCNTKSEHNKSLGNKKLLKQLLLELVKNGGKNKRMFISGVSVVVKGSYAFRLCDY